MAEENIREYLIEKADGTKLKVKIPNDWKVTFGPAVKGKNQPTVGERRLKMPMALRFYENETKQRAIFLDVVEFRDLSIPIEVEKVDIQEKDGFTEVDGVRQRSTFQVKTKKWTNPDEINEDTPKLPNASVHSMPE
jgi:hypothetical protein